MEPWYKGWTGTLEREDDGSKKWTQSVPFELLDDDDEGTVLEITDLPIGKWTRDYKNFVESDLVTKAELVDDVREYHAENRVHFKLSLTAKGANYNNASIAKHFKL